MSSSAAQIGSREREWRPLWRDRVPRATPPWAREVSLPLPIARVLAARGIASAAEADSFLNPRLSTLGDPFALPDMRAATDRIWRAITKGEQIAVFGDYDVDGVSSTALLTKILRALGARAEPILPHRLEEGYGLSLDAFRRCVETLHPSLVVTVDCGTSAEETVREASRLGIDVVITDHHEPGPRIAPAIAVVNPKRGSDTAHHALAGAGVAFKLCHALLKQGRNDGNPRAASVDLREVLDLVALGTIADVVPLTGENRILTRHGLAVMNRKHHPGLRELCEVAKLVRDIDAYEVGFILGPRLNAAGRLGDACRALNLLLAEPGTDLKKVAAELDASNRERREVEERVFREACEALSKRFDATRDFGLVVTGEGWHPGVIGIVASRLVQRFYRPAVVVSIFEGRARGSCRSIEGFDMVAALSACAGSLSKFGGHAAAAGVELDPERLEEFASAFNKAAALQLQEQMPVPIQPIDGWVDLGDIDLEFLRALDRLRPFGLGNPTPVWAARGVRITQPPRIVGNGHLKLMIASGGRYFDAIGWRMGGREIPEGPIDIAFQPRLEIFNGVERISLHLQDFRPTDRG